MPRIPGPQDVPTTTAQAVSPVASDPAQAANALVNLGQGISEVATTLRVRRQEAENAGFMSHLASSTDAAFTKAFDDHKSEASTDDENFTQNFNSKLNDVSQSLLKDAREKGGFRPDRRTMQSAELRLANMRGAYNNKAVTFENNARIDKIKAQHAKTSNEFASHVLLNPEFTQDKLTDIENLFNESGGVYTDDEIRANKLLAKEQVSKAGILGLIRQDPELAAEVLRDEEGFANHLKVQDRSRLIGQADAAVEANAVEEAVALIEEFAEEVDDLELSLVGGETPPEVVNQKIDQLFDEKKIDLNERTRLKKMVLQRVEINQRQAEADAAESAAQVKRSFEQEVSNIEIQVAAGVGDANEQSKRVDEIWRTGGIDTTKRTSMQKAIIASQEKRKRENDQISLVADVLNGDRLADPVRDREAFNDYYTKVMVPFTEEMSTVERAAVNENFIRKTGIVPQELTRHISAQLRSRDPNLIVDAAENIDRIDHIPGVQHQFNAKDLAFGQEVVKLTRVGVQSDVAIDQASQLVDPKNKVLVETRVSEIKEERFDEDYMDWAADALDPGIFTIQAEPDNTIGPFLKRDYKNAFETFYKLTGDESSAKSFADRTIRKTWGTTEVGGTKRLIQYPPEMFYPIDPDDLTAQLAADVAAENIGAEGSILVSDDITARTASTGAPTYAVGILTPNGWTVMNKRWHPDTGILEEQAETTISEARQRRLSRQALEREITEPFAPLGL